MTPEQKAAMEAAIAQQNRDELLRLIRKEAEDMRRELAEQGKEKK
jgi:hypothetical protein